MSEDIKCWSCDDPLDENERGAYCAACRKAIQSEADELGLSFQEAASKLNASRKLNAAPVDSGHSGTPDYPRADWDYHGKRRYDV